ncbi:MAG: polyphosphate kinase 2 [Candidatus Pelagisphaera sp.]|jgi:polyphosphate kinase 2
MAMNNTDFVDSRFFDFYNNISYSTYLEEKRRLQVELINLQHWVINNRKRVALVFEGRDAAGKGSSIKRFTEYMMPKHFKIVELGIPTPKESKNWFRRYQKHFPKEGEITFFDRSWYNRALIEPTMGYCSKAQYKYFMSKVLDWEEKQIQDGLIIIKVYLSVSKHTQSYRFKERQVHPLKYWKYSANDQVAREHWDTFTKYKEQMFRETSSPQSPWAIINSNNKLETRLKSMLYVLSQIPYKEKFDFRPLQKEEKRQRYSITVDGVAFNNLNYRQFMLLETMATLYNS